AAPPAKGAPVASAAPTAKVAPPVAPAAPAALKKAAPREKDHFFIIENLCVGCGLCLDKCPPKVKAIGYKFYGDVQEGGFRAYIDQDACISCASCFNAGECPAAALVKVHPDGEVLDYVYTPPERLDFDLRFLHRFHREVR
ncbi:MAG: 4Fe-4S dicluster domain-containing protein, partial [Chlorobium sp.]